MRKLILALAIVAPLLAACNTVEGFGKDMKKVGDKIEKTADDAK